MADPNAAGTRGECGAALGGIPDNDGGRFPMSLSQAEAGFALARRPGFAFDPRFGQIAAQSTLLVLELTWLDFGPSPLQAAVFIAGTLSLELVRASASRTAFNWRSVVSTGLSLSLLLRTHEPLLWLVACVLGVGSKIVLRANGKHLFNPSAFAIVVLLLASDQ